MNVWFMNDRALLDRVLELVEDSQFRILTLREIQEKFAEDMALMAGDHVEAAVREGLIHQTLVKTELHVFDQNRS